MYELEEDTSDEEVVATEWSWGKKTVLVPSPWGKEENYDFDVTKADKLFDFLLDKGQIKLLTNYLKIPPKELKIRSFVSIIMLLLMVLMIAGVFW